MSVLASNCGHICADTKELFREVDKHLESFTDERWERFRDTPCYKEVAIAVYIRTDKSNRVLLVDKDTFADIANIPHFIRDAGVYPNILIDAGVVCGRNLVETVFNLNSEEVLTRFAQNSTCYPVGAVETPKNYVLVFSIVISDSLLEDTEISIKQGYEFCDIKTLDLKDDVQKKISESLVLVESEEE